MNSAPSSFGILKSVMTRSGAFSTDQSSAEVASAKARTVTSLPSELASFARIFRLVTRSSMTTMTDMIASHCPSCGAGFIGEHGRTRNLNIHDAVSLPGGVAI